MNSVIIPSLDTTAVNVSNLVAGFVYRFTITAENGIGSSSISCEPTSHLIGK